MSLILSEMLKRELAIHLGDEPWYVHLGTFNQLEEICLLSNQRKLRIKGLHVSCVTLNQQTEYKIVCVMMGDYIHEYHTAILNENTDDLFEVAGRLNTALERLGLPTYSWSDTGDAIIGHILE